MDANLSFNCNLTAGSPLEQIFSILALMERNQANIAGRLTLLEERLGQPQPNAAANPPALPNFYVVARGRLTGVYTTSQEANQQTRGVRNAVQRRFHTMQEALAFVAEYSIVDPIEQPLYAVAVGRRPGVYTSSQQANIQTSQFANARQHRFYSLEEALAYIEENRDHDLGPVVRPLYILDREGETFDEEDMSD